MDFVYYLPGLLFSAALPIGVVVGSVFLASKTELGRAVIGRLKSARRDAAVMEELSAKMDGLHEDMVDIQERLDSTELLLRSHQNGRAQLHAPPRDSQ